MLRTPVAGWIPSEVIGGSARGELTRSGQFLARLAVTDRQRDAVYRLRFRVFNLELKEGLESAYLSGRDVDEFDQFCDHILIEDSVGEIIGTYRVQPGTVALRALGFYSEQEFQFAPYRAVSDKIVELGRACILREYRSYEVLALLWRAVALYAKLHGAQYLIGCSSVTSQDPDVGWAMYRKLRCREVPEDLATVPTWRFGMPEPTGRAVDVRIPKLLRAYLGVGARICGPPALDREFKTIDFLTLLDIESMSATARAHFFG